MQNSFPRSAEVTHKGLPCPRGAFQETRGHTEMNLVEKGEVIELLMTAQHCLGADVHSLSTTHTLSRSMSWLWLALPSVVRRSLKALISSASSGLRLNSAGNSEIQYLQGRTKGWKDRETMKRIDLLAFKQPHLVVDYP